MPPHMRWIAKIPAGHRFHEDALTKVISKTLEGHPCLEIVKPNDGELRFIVIPSSNLWIPINGTVMADERHIALFRELSTLQELLEDIPFYYGRSYSEAPEHGDSEYEALSVMVHYAAVNERFILVSHMLSLEAEAKGTFHGG